MKGLLSSDKVALNYFASIEKDITKLYKQAILKDTPETQAAQIELLKQILERYLKGPDHDKENKTKNEQKHNQQSSTAIRTQQLLLEKEQQVQRLNRQLAIQFQMTKSFVDQFMKDLKLPMIKNQHIGMPQSILDYKRKDFETLNLRSSGRFSCRQSLTSRDEPMDLGERLSTMGDEPFQKQNKTLAKLNKLQKFLLKMPSRKTERKEQFQLNSVWNFSPTKAEYKHENETLRALQDHLLNRLQQTKPLNLDELPLLLKREESLKLRQRKCQEREEELMRKEIAMNKRHMEVMRKQKQLKTHF